MAPLHVLFVDDDQVFCEYFHLLAKPFSLNFDMVHTYQDAKDLIEAGKADAYIFDANLPDGSGYDLAALVREEYGENVPVVVISGVFKDSEHFTKLKDTLKVDYVLDKPISSDHVQRLLQELTSQKKHEDVADTPMDRLKQKYKKMIPGIIAELGALIDAVKQAKTAEAVQALKQSVHKIAGSAGSVGYPEVSDLCKLWERSLIKKLDTIAETPINSDWIKELDDFFGRLKFHYQVSSTTSLPQDKPTKRVEENSRRLPLYVVDSDRTLLATLEREQPDFVPLVTTEWDPEKAKKMLAREEFNPRILIVGESFRASPVKGSELIDIVRNKKTGLKTDFGIILDDEDLNKRAVAIREGITYVLEKPISGKLFLNTIQGALHFDESHELKVLIVEDDPVVSSFIAAALEEKGIIHKTLLDGTRLFDEIKEFKPDILLLDIYLPGYNGVELLKTLRSDVRFGHLMIVIITASQDNELLSEAYTGNVDDILHKPLDKKIIQTRILSLGKKHAQNNQHDRTDPVTGLPNRSAFNVYIHEKLLNAEYARVGVFVALIEFDQFSQIKDSESIENILSRFSNLMVAKEKQLGFESYLGKGRFGIVSEIMDFHSFKSRIEEFLEAAQQEILPPSYVAPRFTFSCGLISLPLHYTEQNQLFRSAEAALVEAKQLGQDNPIKIVAHLNGVSAAEQKRRVILIDQDEDLVQILRTSFESRGIDVSTYQLGEKFLEDLFINQHPLPPLLIMERMLPDMDGIDLLRRLHKRYPVQLPVIFLSSLSSDKDVLDGLKAGALDYITKPFNLHHMLQKSITALTR